MKGVIFKNLEAFIAETFGDDVYERILDATELRTDGPFISPGTYPDEDLLALVGTAIEQLGIPLDDALLAFGRFLFAGLARTVPELSRPEIGLVPFLQSIHGVIHVEVKKLYPDARTPRFVFLPEEDGRATLHYTSQRKLCPLVVGLIEGAAAHFGEPVRIEQTGCVHDGAQRCTFELTFGAAAQEAA